MNLDDILVVLPARHGSKRIPQKNIYPVLGKPMIHWPIEELLKKFKPSQLLLSTDAVNIKTCVEKFEIDLRYTRPKELADDFTTSLDILPDALNWFQEHVTQVKYVLMVYPTSILLRLTDIYNALVEMESDREIDVVFSAVEFDFPIERSILVDRDGFISPREPSKFTSRSQDLNKFMHDAGQFYLFKSASVSLGMNFTDLNAKIVEIERERSVDIDEIKDLEIAKIFLKHFLTKEEACKI